MLVASFNLKNSYAFGSKNNWIKHADAIAELIKTRNLDVVGTQEFTIKAKSYLESILKEYSFIGNPRGSVSITNEYNCILLKKDAFLLSGNKTYSLSKDIYKNGGKFLFDVFPRICTLAHVTHDNQKYLIMNTHLDNLFGYDRKRQLEVITNIIAMEKNPDEALIITGDFNMTLVSYLKQFQIQNGLVDAVTKEMGNSFRNITSRDAIDHIFVSKDFIDIENVLYDKQKYNGVYPSDHYPVLSLLKKK